MTILADVFERLGDLELAAEMARETLAREAHNRRALGVWGASGRASPTGCRGGGGIRPSFALVVGPSLSKLGAASRSNGYCDSGTHATTVAQTIVTIRATIPATL